ncbi:MAG: 6-phosphogluconolactonase, partial [Clostridium sp.]|nr:6-phosphogluconolactonase [Clostridium sp.]
MRIIITKNYEELSKVAANEMAETIKNNPKAILGLATGGSPIGMYKELIRMNKEGEIDFSTITTVNLDEYVGLSGEHTQSYRYFMNDNLFNHINIDKKNLIILIVLNFIFSALYYFENFKMQIIFFLLLMF